MGIRQCIVTYPYDEASLAEGALAFINGGDYDQEVQDRILENFFDALNSAESPVPGVSWSPRAGLVFYSEEDGHELDGFTYEADNGDRLEGVQAVAAYIFDQADLLKVVEETTGESVTGD